MSFASFEFVIFFVVVLACTGILQYFGWNRGKEVFLLLVSFFFYGYWDWRFCFLLLFVIIIAYFSAQAADKKACFLVGVVVPLAVLGVFKYFNFFLASLSAVTGRNIGTLKIILPVGISFYTFQALSYVIDVHRKKLPVEHDFIRLALYLSFFPQLVAGPIVRAADFLPQLREDRRITLEGLERGVQLIVFGMLKKMVLADHLSVFVDDVFRVPGAFHWATILLAVISYSIQIYFDFSGYSDIAIGCAKCMGYDFLPNFNLPYLSENITVFWRRWHISLSTWLKEYLYIPLGGNRRGKTRRFVNLFLTMLLGGLWHGANWTFVFWGFLHGLALCVDKLIPRRTKEIFPGKMTGILGTYLFVCFTWIFFRADTFQTAWQVIYGICSLQQGIHQPFFWSILAIAVLLTASGAAAWKACKAGEKEICGYYPIMNLDSVFGLVVFFVACGLVLGLAFTGEAPFVYFQF